MEELKSYLQKIDKKWLVIWSIIYGGFLILDLIHPGSNPVTIVKILGIILCLFYVNITTKNEPFLIAAFVCTIVADLVLAFKNTSAIGVLVFCLAQFFHMMKMAKLKLKSFVVYMLIVTLIIIFGVFLKVDMIFVVAFIYAGTLVTNLILAGQWCVSGGSLASKLAFAGFLLFLGCDLCVAVSYLSLIGVLPAHLYMMANYLAWAFYYPSQVFLSNSSDNMI